MLATLNLQFSPVEITDDTLLTPTMAPDVAPIAEFADLLRLRVDTAQGLGTGDGQELPPGGSDLPQGGTDLPLQALPIEFDSLQPLGQDVLPLETPLGDISQEEVPLTPALVRQAAGQPQPASLTLDVEPPIPAATTPAIKANEPLVTIADSREVTLTTQSRPLPVVQPGLVHAGTPAEIQQTVTSLAGKLEPITPAPREPTLPIQAQPAAVADVDKSMPIVELPRRTEPLPMPAVKAEEISDVFKARPTVTQTVQVLNAQPNPQQAIVMPTAPAAVSADTGFAAAVQQASDLISVPVRDTAWAGQIGERVLMMAGKQMTSAEIRLTPAELGPLRVQVSVDDGAANVTFQAQHAVTREAIEQALPRLRELLAENGLSLGQASVGEQGVAEGRHEEPSNSPHAVASEATEGDETGESNEPRRVVASDSLVDTFA